MDKDGNNKYITEILADTLLLLEKKQGTGSTMSQSGASKSSTPEKGYSTSGVDEPGVTYHTGNENNKTSPGKEINGTDDFSGEGSSGNGPVTGVNEDDLPF